MATPESGVRPIERHCAPFPVGTVGNLRARRLAVERDRLRERGLERLEPRIVRDDLLDARGEVERRLVVVGRDQRLELRQRLLARPVLAAALLQGPGERTGQRDQRERGGQRPPSAEHLPHWACGLATGRERGRDRDFTVGRDATGRSGRRETRLDRRDDLLADLVLQGKGVLEPPVVPLGPDVLVPRGVDELRGHADPVVDLAYASLDDVLAAELARDRPRIDLASLVGEGRLA